MNFKIPILLICFVSSNYVFTASDILDLTEVNNDIEDWLKPQPEFLFEELIKEYTKLHQLIENERNAKAKVEVLLSNKDINTALYVAILNGLLKESKQIIMTGNVDLYHRVNNIFNVTSYIKLIHKRIDEDLTFENWEHYNKFYKPIGQRISEESVYLYRFLNYIEQLPDKVEEFIAKSKTRNKITLPQNILILIASFAIDQDGQAEPRSRCVIL